MNIKIFSVNPPIKIIFLGKIGSPYGISGWCRIISFTQNTRNILQYQPWFIKQKNEYYLIHLEKWNILKKKLLLNFKVLMIVI